MPSYMSGNKIVGGEDAPDPIPWQVSLRRGGKHFCGGTILDAKTILSAAHCTDVDGDLSGHYVMAGSTNKFSGGQVVEIEKGIWTSGEMAFGHGHTRGGPGTRNSGYPTRNFGYFVYPSSLGTR